MRLAIEEEIFFFASCTSSSTSRTLFCVISSPCGGGMRNLIVRAPDSVAGNAPSRSWLAVVRERDLPRAEDPSESSTLSEPSCRGNSPATR